MKYINKNILSVNDFTNLKSIKKPPNSHIHLSTVYKHKDDLKTSYINYIFFAKNYRLKDLPISSKIKMVGKDSFIEHYINQKYFSDFISDFRSKNRSGFCYMCGGMNAGTLDHLLPKDNYPEFSFFSKNLIPSCDCNSKKNNNISSGLNPHFYKECDRELFYLDIFINGFVGDQIQYEFYIKVKNGFSVKFFDLLNHHLLNHMMKFSDIENYMKNQCARILNNPIKALSIRRKISRSQLIEKIEDLSSISESEAGSPNRWDVILYKGLLKRSVVTYILGEIHKQYP